MTKEKFIELVSKIHQTGEDEFKANFNSPELMWYNLLEREFQSLYITIEKLEKRNLWLTCLEQAGVDNWEGMDVAHEILEENN